MPDVEIDPVPETPSESAAAPVGRFGAMTARRVVALVLAVAFLAGAVGWAVGQRTRDPLSGTDVGFMQDMGYHHEQAIQMSLLLLGDREVDPDLSSFAQEIIIGQRYEQGIFNATLDRFGHPSAPGEQAMGWMGRPIPRDEMPGLASDEQMEQLRRATGSSAAALWIALMTEHHLAGLHMADWATRKGQDRTTRNIARAMVRSQRGEVIDLNQYRINHDLPIPDGFGDPLEDQRLNPLSLSES